MKSEGKRYRDMYRPVKPATSWVNERDWIFLACESTTSAVIVKYFSLALSLSSSLSLSFYEYTTNNHKEKDRGRKKEIKREEIRKIMWTFNLKFE